MQIAAAPFFPIVCQRLIRIRPKIIAKREMALNFGATSRKAMQLNDPPAGERIIKRAVPPAANAVLSPPRIAEIFQRALPRVELIERFDLWHQIEYRLSANPWNSRRADVVNGDQVRVERRRNSCDLLASHPYPISGMRNKLDLDWRQHGDHGNWRRKRTSFWKSSGSSVTPYFIIARRSMPMPKAKPECFAAS